MGCTSSKDDEERPGTRQNSFTFGSVSLWRSSSALKQLGATAGATKGPLAPGMGEKTSLDQPLPPDESSTCKANALKELQKLDGRRMKRYTLRSRSGST